MPAKSSVVLTDRATPTPVNHTLVPMGPGPNDEQIFEKSGIAVGAPSLTVSTRRLAGKKFKARFVLKVPKTQDETINGVVKTSVIRTGYAEISFTFDGTATSQERKDVVGMAETILKTSTTLFDTTLTNAEPIY